MKHIFFLILTAGTFSHCKTAEQPKKYSFDCYVRYLETEARLHAEATLREGDPAPRPVEVAGGISYQGKPMTLKQLSGPVYKTDLPGGTELKHVFSWKDDKGKPHSFDMQVSPVTDFGFDGKTLLRQKPATFHWQGAPMAKGETFVFLWENAALRKTVPMEIYNTGSQPVIEFPAAQLAKLDPGEWTLYLVRKKLVKSDAGGIPASGVFEYYTKTETIRVE